MLLQNNNLSIWWVINNIAKICAIKNNLYFISTEADFLTYKQWKEILVTLYWIIKSIQLTLIFVQSIEFFYMKWSIVWNFLKVSLNFILAMILIIV